MAKYLEDKRRRLQGQQTEAVQKQPVQYTPKTVPAVQTQAAAPAPVQKQTAAPAPTPQATPQRTLEQQAGAINQVPSQQVHTTTAAPAQTGTSDVVAQAQDYLNQQLGSYNSRYGSQITDLLQQLQNRPAFEYDVNTDPLYLQLRDIWKQDGLMAMEDTMGQAAQLTGGYGNSHAQMAGQQVYNNHLREVAEMVPQLKEAARADYDADTDALLRNLGLLMDQDSTDYTRWMDELERQRYAEQQEYDRGRDALADQRYEDEWAYQQDRDALADQRYQDELAYGREQDDYARQQVAYDRLLELIIATGYQPTAEELAAAGMTEAEAKAWRGYYTANLTGGGSSGGGGYRTSSTRSTKDEDTGDDNEVKRPPKTDFETLQEELYVMAGEGASAPVLIQYAHEAYKEGKITSQQMAAITRWANSLAPVNAGNKNPGNGWNSPGGGGGGRDSQLHVRD
jgi:hypothetical protein